MHLSFVFACHNLLGSEVAVHKPHLQNAMPVIASAYNRKCQSSLAPPLALLHIFHNQGHWIGTEAKRSFLSLNKTPLRQIVLPRLISFGLFFLASHEGICGRGQTFHLIKNTFHTSSPLSPCNFSFHPSFLPASLPLCLSAFLSSIIRSPKVPFAVTVPFWWALDAFWNHRLTHALMLPSNSC